MRLNVGFIRWRHAGFREDTGVFLLRCLLQAAGRENRGAPSAFRPAGEPDVRLASISSCCAS